MQSKIFGFELYSCYEKQIVDTFHADEVGNFCRKDALICKFAANILKNIDSLRVNAYVEICDN